jgi:hypothetical protein
VVLKCRRCEATEVVSCFPGVNFWVGRMGFRAHELREEVARLAYTATATR